MKATQPEETYSEMELRIVQEVTKGQKMSSKNATAKVYGYKNWKEMINTFKLKVALECGKIGGYESIEELKDSGELMKEFIFEEYGVKV